MDFVINKQGFNERNPKGIVVVAHLSNNKTPVVITDANEPSKEQILSMFKDYLGNGVTIKGVTLKADYVNEPLPKTKNKFANGGCVPCSRKMEDGGLLGEVDGMLPSSNNMSVIQPMAKGGKPYTKEEIESFSNDVNAYVYYTFNYYSPNHFEAFGSKESSMYDHIRSKFSGYYNILGANSFFNQFWVELDGGNQLKLATWIKENYKHSSTSRLTSTNQEFAHNIQKWVMFCFNYPHTSELDFMNAWKGSMKEHLGKKFSNYYETNGATGVMNNFYVNLDGGNQMLLSEWVLKNYSVMKLEKGGSTYQGGGEIKRSEMEEWFYDHDNEWQNDLEIDHQQEDTDLDLIEWAYYRYHDKGGSTYEGGGEIKTPYGNSKYDSIKHFTVSGKGIYEDGEDDYFLVEIYPMDYDSISEENIYDTSQLEDELRNIVFDNDISDLSEFDSLDELKYEVVMEDSTFFDLDKLEIVDTEYHKADGGKVKYKGGGSLESKRFKVTYTPTYDEDDLVSVWVYAMDIKDAKIEAEMEYHDIEDIIQVTEIKEGGGEIIYHDREDFYQKNPNFPRRIEITKEQYDNNKDFISKQKWASNIVDYNGYERTTSGDIWIEFDVEVGDKSSWDMYGWINENIPSSDRSIFVEGDTFLSYAGGGEIVSKMYKNGDNDEIYVINVNATNLDELIAESKTNDELDSWLRGELGSSTGVELPNGDIYWGSDIQDHLPTVERDSIAYAGGGKTNSTESFVEDLMNFSPYGAMSQMFIIDGIGKYIQYTDSYTDEDIANDRGIIDAQTWVNTGKDIRGYMDSFYAHDGSYPNKKVKDNIGLIQDIIKNRGNDFFNRLYIFEAINWSSKRASQLTDEQLEGDNWKNSFVNGYGWRGTAQDIQKRIGEYSSTKKEEGGSISIDSNYEGGENGKYRYILFDDNGEDKSELLDFYSDKSDLEYNPQNSPIFVRENQSVELDKNYADIDDRVTRSYFEDTPQYFDKGGKTKKDQQVVRYYFEEEPYEYSLGGSMASGGEIEEYSIRTNFSDADFDNEEQAREFWEDLSQEERDSGQFFRKVWVDGVEDEVELLYAKGGSMKSGGLLYGYEKGLWFDHILEGADATEENAYDHARGIDWQDIETTEDEPAYMQYVDTVNGVGIYHNYGTDSYHFKDEVEEGEKLAGGGKVSNKESSQYARNKEPFNGSNLSGKTMPNKAYVVLSYGYYPLYVYKYNKWYENNEKYSVSTSKQQSQSRPTNSTIKKSTEQLKKLAGL
tara:strand:- start:1784 stop:5524 length:3741 start_codon:yes stop_codon:yes gene_type:complete